MVFLLTLQLSKGKSDSANSSIFRGLAIWSQRDRQAFRGGLRKESENPETPQ